MEHEREKVPQSTRFGTPLLRIRSRPYPQQSMGKTRPLSAERSALSLLNHLSRGVGQKTPRRRSSLHTIGSQTVRSATAPQPVLTRDTLLYIERSPLDSRAGTAPQRCAALEPCCGRRHGITARRAAPAWPLHRRTGVRSPTRCHTTPPPGRSRPPAPASPASRRSTSADC